MLEINWNPEKVSNENFLSLYSNKSRYLILYGGAGSGKSHFAAQKFLLRIIKSIKYGYKEKFLFIRHIGRTCRQSVYSLFRHYLYKSGLGKYTQINKSNMSFHFPNGSEVFCEGLDDPEKIKSYFDITSLWIEEATELSAEGFRQLDLRMRGETPSYKQIILTFNPITKMNWAYKEFFEKDNLDIKIHHSTYKDNQFIDEKYIEILNNLKEKDLVFYNIYALGEWGILGNLVYTNWQIKNISQDDRDYETVRCGLDFGFNNPSAFVRIGIKDNDLYIMDEFYQDKLTNPDLMRILRYDKKISWDDQITADSAEPARIIEFKSNGYNVKESLKGKDSVRKGIEWCRRRKIYIHPSCINFQNEISMYKYQENKNKKISETDEKEEPVKFKDHLMDAMRYAVEDYVLHEASDAESLGIAFV